MATNLVLLATYNPTDRSAIDLDAALLRRMRILQCLPDTDQLEEMLSGRSIPQDVVERLKLLFTTTRERHGSDYDDLMPFGHGLFAQVNSEQPDLYDLWFERIRHILYRPLVEPHPFAATIEECYPWKVPGTSVL